MRPTLTRGAQYNFQKPKNWNEQDGNCGDLQVRAETFGERNIVELFSTWKPTEEERQMLAAGGVVEVGVCTSTQPVMQVRVVEPVDERLSKYLSHEGTAEEDAQEARPAALTINEDAHGHG